MEKNTASKKIQRWWRLQKLKKAINILRLNKEIIKKYNFNSFAKKIQEKKLLKLVTYMINKTNRIADFNNFDKDKINAKEFMSSFLIYGYKDHVIGNEKTLISNMNNLIPIEKNVCEYANKLVEYYNDIAKEYLTIPKIKNLYRKMLDFKMIFKMWKVGDFQQIIQILSASYHEIENTKKVILDGRNIETLNENEKEFIIYSVKQQKNILEKIQKLNGNEIFENFKPINIELDDTFKEKIKETYEKAYWDVLKNELNSQPKVYDQLIMILSEIRNRLCSFIPNRPDMHNTIFESIDIELIKQMAENNAMDGTQVYNICMYIIDMIKGFQPPEYDITTEEWKKNVQKSFVEGFEYSDFLPVFFKKTFERLEAVDKYIKEFKQTELYKRILELNKLKKDRKNK